MEYFSFSQPPGPHTYWALIVSHLIQTNWSYSEDKVGPHDVIGLIIVMFLCHDVIKVIRYKGIKSSARTYGWNKSQLKFYRVEFHTVVDIFLSSR